MAGSGLACSHDQWTAFEGFGRLDEANCISCLASMISVAYVDCSTTIVLIRDNCFRISSHQTLDTVCSRCIGCKLFLKAVQTEVRVKLAEVALFCSLTCPSCSLSMTRAADDTMELQRSNKLRKFYMSRWLYCCQC